MDIKSACIFEEGIHMLCMTYRSLTMLFKNARTNLSFCG